MPRPSLRRTPQRVVAAALAATLAATPACGPAALSTAGMHLSATTDTVGAAGDAIVAALRARRDAAAPPLALTAIDPAEPGPGDEPGATEANPLTLTSVTADVVIDGPLAYTQLALSFANPEHRTREGRFSVTLPTDAAIGRFAMRTDTGWREAEVVSRIRAREVYDEYVRRGVDPALLEQASANTFTARVFPIRPDAATELMIGYSQEVTLDHPPRLALHGLPRIHELTIRVHRGADVDVTTRRDVKPDDVTTEVGTTAAAVGSATEFVARVAVPATKATVPIESLYVLVDTSASRAGLVGTELHALRELVHGLPAATEVTIAAFDQRVAELFRGRAGDVDDGVDDAIVARGALGASDLGAGLAAAAAGGRARVVLIGDAVATAGDTEPEVLAARLRGAGIARVDVVQVGESLDAVAAAAIVEAGDHTGAVIRSERGTADLAAQLVAATAAPASITVDGATWSWPSSTSGAAGAELVVYGRRPAGAVDRELRISVGDHTVAITPTTAPTALVTRAVARAELAVLSTRAARTAAAGDRRALRDQIRTIALRNRLVSSETSLLVLESDDDYARMCLSQDRLPDLIVVDGTRGLQSRARTAPAGGPAPECADAAIANDDAPGDLGTAEAALTARSAGRAEAERGEAEQRAAAEAEQRAAAEAEQRAAAEAEAEAARTPPRRSPDGHDAGGPAGPAGPTGPTGTISGVITDQITGERLAGVTVVVTAPGMAGAETAITDENGAYVITGIPAGTALVAVYYNDLEITRTIEVSADAAVTVSMAIDSSTRGEVIEIRDTAPTIDPASTMQGMTIDADYTANIPTGRTFDATLAVDGAGVEDDAVATAGDAPASQRDAAAALASLPAVVRDRARARRIAAPVSADEFGGAATVPGRDHAPAPEVGVLADVLADIARGDTDRAVVRAARAQVESPADLGALLALGAAAEARGAHALALRVYGSMIDLYPGQAEIVRAAAVRLERLGADGLDLALDAYARAAADRPDHLHGMRLWAWARARAGDLDGALAVLERALATPSLHADDAADALAGDLAIVSAVIAAADSTRRPALETRLTALGIPWAATASTRAVLSWETDANDVDLHVIDRAGGHAWYSARELAGGGRLLADITRGYGPEVFIVGAGDPGPLRVAAHYYSRGPMGVGLGALQVIHHDAAAGTVTIETRPFALQRDDAVVGLGTIPGATR